MTDEVRELWRIGDVRCLMVSCCSGAELQVKQDDPPEQPAPAAPEPARGANANTGPFEFHTDQWEAAYIKRIDATIAALKSAGVPVLWVGLPAQRGAVGRRRE